MTLWLLSIIVFVGAQILPGNPGRSILGPFADDAAVEQLNHELGFDRPVLTRYWEWLSGFFQGDLGTSFVFQTPVTDRIGDSMLNSLNLGSLAIVIVVPISIICGLISA
ncbi:MAG: ABC transporter permease, partial [Actinobacteria bacterium]|nr:ABC transporter permease [Actinomycetota bacterium]